MTLCGTTRLEFLGEADEQAFGATNVAKPIRLLVPNHLADELRAAPAEPNKCVIDVVYREHRAQVAERVHRGVPVIGDHGRGEESRKLEPTVAVWSDQHGDLDVLRAQPRDASGPLSFDRGSPFESEAKLDEKRNDSIEGFYYDANVVHPLERHPNNTGI